MRSLMFMLFGQMIVRGKGQIDQAKPSAIVTDARIRTSSTVVITFTGTPPVVAVPQPFTVDMRNGSFSVILPGTAPRAPAPFDWVLYN